MEQCLTEFESIVQRREHYTQSTYEGCAYDKLSEVLFTLVIQEATLDITGPIFYEDAIFTGP